jgi:hypothetical protein
LPARALKAAAAALVLAGLLAGCDSGRAVTGPKIKAYEVALSVSGQKTALAWHGGEAGRDRIEFEWLDADGRANSPVTPITDGTRYAYEPDLEMLDGQPVLAWYEKDDKGTLTAWLERTDAGGRSLWRRPLSAEGGFARNPVIQVQGGVIYAAWIETAPGAAPSVWAQRFDPQGRPLTVPVRAGEASKNTWNLNAAVDGQGAQYVVYDARRSARAKELRLAVIGNGPVRDIQLTPDDGHDSVYPDLKIGPSGQAALTWWDEKDGNEEVYLVVAPLASFASGSMPAARRITHTEAPSIGAYLAWNGDTLGLVWCDAEEGHDQLYGQLFDATGHPETGVRRLTHTARESLIPSIQPSGRGFLMAWNEYAGGGGADDTGHQRTVTSTAMTRRFDP